MPYPGRGGRVLADATLSPPGAGFHVSYVDHWAARIERLKADLARTDTEEVTSGGGTAQLLATAGVSGGTG